MPGTGDAILLCESCGYPLGEAAAQSRCPECGEPTAASMPGARTGTPWQRGESVRSWARTNVMMLRRPGEWMRRVRIEEGSGTRLAVVNLAVASALLVAPWTGTLIGDPARAAHGAPPLVLALTYGWVFLAQVAVVGAVLLALTLIEYAGIWFYAGRRGWRLTPAAAWQVCCHATVGWIVCGLAPLLVMAMLFTWVLLRGALPSGVLDLGAASAVRIEWQFLAAGVPIALGYLAGLLIFESLVYVGVRRCRFANAPSAGFSVTAPTAPTAAPADAPAVAANAPAASANAPAASANA